VSAGERLKGAAPAERMAKARRRYDWAVLNQSQSPVFQRMLEQLSADLGACLLITGMPYPVEQGRLDTQAAPRYDRRSVPRRAWAWLLFVAASLGRVLRLPSRTFLLAVTNPPVLPHVAWLAHKVRGNAYGLLVWDVYPDHMVNMGLVREKGLLSRLWRGMNARAMRDARVVITLGEGMREALRRQLGGQASCVRIEVIPNWADTDQIRPIRKAENPFAVEHGQAGRLTVLYSGNMGTTHELDTVVEAAGLFQGDPRVSFLLIGDGLGRDKVEREVAARGLANVRLLPRQPWAALPYSLAAGDVAIVTQTPGSERLSVPSKVYSLMAAGCAVIACTHQESDLARLVRDGGLGSVCAQGDARGVAEAISRLAEEPEVLAASRSRARRAAVEQYSLQAVLPRLRDVLGQAMGRPSGAIYAAGLEVAPLASERTAPARPRNDDWTSPEESR
jgi:colanic acid biosynthesis glycosyl transferase WcaI